MPDIRTISAYSILIPAVIALYKFRHADRNYRYFMGFIWLGVLSETAGQIFKYHGRNTVEVYNIYVFFAPFFLVLFLWASGVFKNKRLHVFLLILFATVWAVETSIRTIHDYSIYYRTLYSFVVSLLSITLINKLLASSEHSMIKHPTFYICLGLIIYCTLNALVNAFWVYGNFKSNDFLHGIHKITVYSNLFVYLTYSVGLLWIQKKQASILQY